MPSPKFYTGYVYLIGSVKYGWYKIGCSRSPEIRVSNIGVLLPFRIDVVAIWGTSNAYLLESEMHRTYAEWNINGEWFGFKDKQVQQVLETHSIYPSEMIYRIGDTITSKLVAASNMCQDFVKKGNHIDVVKSRAYYLAVGEWLAEHGLEDTKENRKSAKRLPEAIPVHRERYKNNLRALQAEWLVLQKESKSSG